MKAHKATLILVILFSVLWVCIVSEAAERPWHAGTWDSTLYLDAEQPKTIAIRMELLDKDKHLPKRGVNVSLESEYCDQILLGIWKWNGISWERDYEMIWVVGKKDGNAATEDASDDEVRPRLNREKSIDLGNGVKMEFILIRAGSFYMGSPKTERGRDSDAGPVRSVQITKPFYMSKYEVTQDQYMAVMRKNPSHFSGRNLPADSVTWDETMAFCSKLGSGFRLPTEAEWEYACRAGTDTRFYWGDSDSEQIIKQYCWYEKNADDGFWTCPHATQEGTQSVGQKKPNAWGLYDMSGNVWEWCSDWYSGNYRNALSVNPTGPTSGRMRVLRGGSWDSGARGCRSAYRSRGTPGSRDGSVGFRVVLDLN